MFYNFIKNLIDSLLSCLEELLEIQKAQNESGVHSNLHSRPFEVPVPPTHPPTIPLAPSFHLSDTDSPLYSIMDQETPIQIPSRVGRTTLEDIPVELRCHILSFLSYNEIIRYALTCRTMYNTVKSSVELQYTIELGAQRLIQVHPRSPTVSTAECLRILRDKANAWNSFHLNVTKALRFKTLFESHSIAHHQLGLSNSSIYTDESHIVDLKTYTSSPSRLWSNRPNPVHHTSRCFDETQDLMIIITLPIDVDTDGFKYKILFRTMSTGEEHPLAPGSRVVAGRSVCSEIRQFNLVVSILGDRIAVYVAALDEKWDPYWSLHAWSWHQGGQADQDIGVLGEGHELLDVRFLTKEKLLTLSSDGHIELYNVEDLSKAPRLQARFILPVHRKLGAFRYPSVFHSAASCARLTAPDDHWMWTTNPADRVISVMWGFPLSAFVISARIFFLDIPPAWFDATSEDRLSVPWSSWGPQNSRYFDEEMLGRNGAPSFGVGGSRVIRAVPTAGPNDSSFRLHMTDFNPSAVARGIGKVVREPTTLSGHRPDMEVTTYLPFVEVVHDHVFDVSLWNIVLDEERMLLLTQPRAESEWKMKADLFDM